LNSRRIEELEDIARDPDFVAELMRGFKADTERLLERLRVEVRAENTTAIVDITHALKGAAVGVGAQHLASDISEIESAVENDEGALKVRQLLSALELTYERTVAELNGYLQRKHKVSL
jgi:HPt (histidine-containing phosphotransfer) domain-containing protein